MMEKNKNSMDSIPIDVLFEILMRFPVKSIARFVCVSKLWQKTIRSDEFIRSYSLRSSSNKLSRLLCALRRKSTNEDWYFLTKSAHVLTPPVTREPFLDLPKPQPKVVKEPSQFVSSSLVWASQNPSYAHGLISYLYGDDQIICNPSIGKYITLPVPPLITNGSCFLGYDPINGQHKVLCSNVATVFCYHQVLTLGSQNCSWKLIQCSTPHHPGTGHVCIEGVLYYCASTSFNMKEQVLVRFNLRSESLEVVSVIPEGFDSLKTSFVGFNRLINYHGKVAVVNKNSDHFNLWVLEDAKKQKWSNELLTFTSIPVPESSTLGIFHKYLQMILGTSDMGEIVFAHIWHANIYFLDQKSNRIRSVEVEGSTNHEFLHYVESVMFV